MCNLHVALVRDVMNNEWKIVGVKHGLVDRRSLQLMLSCNG